MNYSESLQYLKQFGNEVLHMKPGLETIELLLERLGRPHLSYPSILIAGTNGKGSVARFLHGILVSCGLRSGLYTSPHLVEVTERLVVGGEPISRDDFASALSEVAALSPSGDDQHPTYFEVLSAAAFLHFARQRIEMAVLEVGLGGRLDSTNVVDPLISVITPVGLDHQQILGNSLAEIAAEKAGIIHPGRPVISAPQRAEVSALLRDRAMACHSEFLELERSRLAVEGDRDGRYRFGWGSNHYQLGVYGSHQIENAALAVQVAQKLQSMGYPLTEEGIRSGIEGVRLASVLNRVEENPAVFFDGAHNPDAARVLVRFLEGHTACPRHLVFGMMKDKDIPGVLSILAPCFQKVYLTTVNSERAASVSELQRVLPVGLPCEDALEALKTAKQGANTVVASGSLYLIGELLQRLGWDGLPSPSINVAPRR